MHLALRMKNVGKFFLADLGEVGGVGAVVAAYHDQEHSIGCCSLLSSIEKRAFCRSWVAPQMVSNIW